MRILCALLLVAGCRTSQPAAAVAAEEEPFVPFEVVAVVEKIEPHGYQDFITDGTVISWTLVTFTVVEPESARGTRVRAYCQGRPRLGDAPLALGESVRFLLPRPVTREGLPLEELKELRRETAQLSAPPV